MVSINHKLITAWKAIRPWIIMVAVLLVLRYTGILSGISYVTGSLLLKTGAMNAGVEAPVVAKSFNYNFKVKDLDGNVIDFKTFKGKTIFLNVWATWCGPCRIEMPSIQKLYDKVNRDEIVFIMLAVDDRKSFDKVVNFVKEKEYTFPVYVPHEFLPDQLMVRTIPTTFVVNSQGKIATQETGAANYDTEEFKTFLEGLATSAD
ncbi:MAG TPA: TlpA disulfide reductase family protein [Chryseolinea sp.]